MSNDYTIALMRLEAAARVLIYARDKRPGDDLGAEADAIAHLEIRSMLESLDKIQGDGPAFDAKAAYEELLKKYKRR